MKTFSLHSARRAAGFTLLEMVITMAIFLLLAGAVFGVITGVLQSTSSLHENQGRRDQIAALNAFLKKKLGDLPVTSSLISYRRGEGEGLVQNGIVFGKVENVTAIDAKLQPNGYYTLRLGFAGGTLSSAGANNFPIPDDDTTSPFKWTPLIHDVKTLHWKFQDKDTSQWVEQWGQTNNKPGIVEFSMKIAGDLQPVTMDFWLPPLTQASVTLPVRAPASAPPSVTTHAP